MCFLGDEPSLNTQTKKNDNPIPWRAMCETAQPRETQQPAAATRYGGYVYLSGQTNLSATTETHSINMNITKSNTQTIQAINTNYINIYIWVLLSERILIVYEALIAYL